MRPIREVYPDAVREDGSMDSWGVGDYDPLLKSLGHEILLKVDDGDYQGDSRLLMRDGERYGLLIFGWGSCSGCDSLQACNTWQDVEELRESLASGIVWKDSAQEMLHFIQNRDWELQYSWHADETKQFVAEASERLK